MTEVERLHLVENMGVFMDTVEPEAKKNDRGPGVTVNINAPDNHIVTGDRIEINIHLYGRAKCSRETDEKGNSEAGVSVETQKISTVLPSREGNRVVA